MVDPDADPVQLSFYCEYPLVDVPCFPVVLFAVAGDVPLGEAPQPDTPFVPNDWQRAVVEDNIIVTMTVEFN